jgi:transcriptional regulator with XRE-family HTH domain
MFMEDIMKDELADYLADFEAAMSPERLQSWRKRLFEAQADSRARDFGLAVREARAVLGLTQVELADKSGIQQREISRIEKCIANPTLKTVDKIMRALNGRVVFSFDASPALAAALSVAPINARGDGYFLSDDARDSKAS